MRADGESFAPGGGAAKGAADGRRDADGEEPVRRRGLNVKDCEAREERAGGVGASSEIARETSGAAVHARGGQGGGLARARADAAKGARVEAGRVLLVRGEDRVVLLLLDVARLDGGDAHLKGGRAEAALVEQLPDRARRAAVRVAVVEDALEVALRRRGASGHGEARAGASGRVGCRPGRRAVRGASERHTPTWKTQSSGRAPAARRSRSCTRRTVKPASPACRSTRK